MATTTSMPAAMAPPPQTLSDAKQEVAVVLCIDSAITTAIFWRQALPSYMIQMLQALHKMYSAQNNQPPLLRLGLIVYTRSSFTPPIVTNSFFTDMSAGLREMQENLVSFGIGSTTGAAEGGMAVLEGLVAAIEMCEHLRAEYNRKPTLPTHPNLPKVPPRNPPACHVILVGSCIPSAVKTPLHNRMSELDDITLETLPAEFVKRNIKLSCLLPGRSVPLVDLFQKTGSQPENPWFKTLPGHVLMLSGFQPPSDNNSVKRPIAAANAGTPADSTSKRPKVSPSPLLAHKNAPTPTATTTDAKPTPAPAMEVTPSSKPAATPQDSTLKQEYQKQMRANALAGIKVPNFVMPPPPSISSSGESNSHAPAGTSTGTPAPSMQQTSSAAAAASQSGSPTKSASNSSQQGLPETPVARPQSQPQNMATPSQQMVRGGHSRSQSTQLPTAGLNLVPPKDSPRIQPSPKPQPILNPTHTRMSSQASNQGMSPLMKTSPNRGEGEAQQQALPGPVGPAMQTNPAVLAHLKATSGTNNNRMQQNQPHQTPEAPAPSQAPAPGTADAIAQQQKILQTRMANQGLVPGGAPEVSATPISPDTWRGSISFSVNPSGPTFEISVQAAKGNKDANPQFMLWPSRLEFSLQNYRLFDINEFGNRVKSGGIPLCLFKPNNAPFLGDNERVQKNDAFYQGLCQSLSNKNAGAAIYFSVPACPPGTGIFLFATQKPGPARTLIGALFLTQSIPPMNPLPEVMAAANNQLAAQMNTGPRTIGVQHSNDAGSLQNAPMFDSTAQALRAQMLMQQQMQAQAAQQQQNGNPTWQQRMVAMQQGQQLGGQQFGGMGGYPNAAAAAAAMRGLANLGVSTLNGPMQGQGSGSTHIPPQAQAQSHLLGNGGLGGVGMGMGAGNQGFNPQGLNQLQARQMAALSGMGNMGGMGGMNVGGMNIGPGGLNFGGGMPNFGGLNNGSGLTADMLRSMQGGFGGPTNG